MFVMEGLDAQQALHVGETEFWAANRSGAPSMAEGAARTAGG